MGGGSSMRVLFAFALLVAAASCKTVDIKWTDCSKGQAGYHGKINNLTITPNPPVLGKPINVVASGSVDETVTDGTYELVIKKSFLKLIDHTDKVCGDSTIKLPLGMGTITVHGLTCPQAAGAVTLGQEMTISNNAPVGKINIALTAKTGKGDKLLCLNVVATVTAAGVEPLDEVHELAALASSDMAFSDAHHAPEIELVSAPAQAGAYTPVVFLHGMGDSGKNPGMKSICNTASKKYPGLYSVCSDVANGMSSITTELDKQLEEFTQSVRADAKLANGFSAVGMSQGNLVLRAYIERVNDPPVHKYVSICGPHNGVGTCPDNLLYRAVCPLWKLAKYSAPIAFADYWKDVSDQKTYLEKSRFLADINNERDTKNATYKANLMKLKKYVLVEAMNDTMVIPHASESHGFWAWGSSGKQSDTDVVQLRDTDAYKGDWLGLKSMDENNQLDIHTYIGDHLRFSSQFWDNTILPYFAD